MRQIKIILNIDGSISKYSPMPPQTPPNTLSISVLYSFLIINFNVVRGWWLLPKS